MRTFASKEKLNLETESGRLAGHSRLASHPGGLILSPERSLGAHTPERAPQFHKQETQREPPPNAFPGFGHDFSRIPVHAESGAAFQPEPQASTSSDIHVPDAIQSSGQLLDSSTREFMESRFGHDFRQVRVHTDGHAAALAQRVKADAYTVGPNIVFGQDRYEPGTVQGRRLLGHELAHVVQQRTKAVPATARLAGAAVNDETALEAQAESAGVAVAVGAAPASLVGVSGGSAFPGVVQRQETKPAVVQKPGPTTKPDDKPKEDTAEALVDDIVKLLSPVTDDADFLLKRDLIEKQLAKPKTFKNLPAKEQQKVPAALKPLYEDAMIARITKFPGKATAVLDKLGAGLKGNTNVKHPNELVEMAKLPTSPSNVKASVGSVNEYIALRAQFGSLENLTSFYADVSSHSFLGRSVTVHKVMGNKLNKAEQLLKDKKWFDIAKNQTRGIGGLEIRPNVNNPSKFSLHSFGWAIDIDAAMNPNVKKFPAGLVRGLTGVSLFEGSEAESIIAAPSDRETAENLLPEAQALKGASTTFQTAFKDEASLQSALIAYLKDRLGATFQDKDFDLSVVKNIFEGKKAVEAARAELDQFKKARKKKRAKGGKDKAADDQKQKAADDQKEEALSTALTNAQKELETRVTALGNFLIKARLDVTKASAEFEEERTEQLVAEKGERALKSEEAKKKKAAQDLEKAKKKKATYRPPSRLRRRKRRRSSNWPRARATKRPSSCKRLTKSTLARSRATRLGWKPPSPAPPPRSQHMASSTWRPN